MPQKVYILADHSGQSLKDTTFELLSVAHQCSKSASITAIILGEDIADLAKELAAKGASEVLYLKGPALSAYTSDGYLQAIRPILNEEAPDLVLISNSPNGWDIAPLLAGHLNVPLASGCSQVSLADDKALFERKAFNGKFSHKVSIQGHRPFIATIERGAAIPYEGSSSGAVRTIPFSTEAGQLRSKFIATKKGETTGLDLTQTPVIVAGGRGIGSPDKLDVVRELATALGGQLGASRAVTDAGWLPHEHQIGSSGVTVSPKLYVACGISGAIQHIVGMKNSGYIIAINKDADAPIFNIADIGVVADLFEIVPALTKAANQTKQ